MQKRNRISSVGGGEQTDADRQLLAQLLAKFGYCVRIGNDKVPNKNRRERYVEYWEES